MTITAEDGPLVTKGVEPALGSMTATVGSTGAPAGYISPLDNPDAGPNCIAHGNMFKDPLYRYKAGGGGVTVGGYPNQALGFLDHDIQTLDIVPSLIATANIAALQAPTINVALTLVAASGAGITVRTAPLTVLNSGLIVPAAAVQIDAAPAWVSVSLASGAMQAWNRAACGRAVSLTSISDIHAINFTIRGYDLYGRPQTETLVGPNANTVNGKKGWKWITSVTPSASSASTVSVGTADIFEFPVRADKFWNTEIMWNNTWITANTGFVAADTTSPATALTGSTRGTYAVQTASDGTKALQIGQQIPPANLLTVAGVLGVTPF